MKNMTEETQQKNWLIILQIISCEIFSIEGVKQERKEHKSLIKAQLIISDGVYFIEALVADIDFEKLDNPPKLYDIIHIHQFIISKFKGRRIPILRKFRTPYGTQSGIIG